MSRFVKLPSEDPDIVLAINVDHVKCVLLDNEVVYITYFDENESQDVIAFDKKEEARSFVDRNFVLLNA